MKLYSSSQTLKSLKQSISKTCREINQFQHEDVVKIEWLYCSADQTKEAIFTFDLISMRFVLVVRVAEKEYILDISNDDDLFCAFDEIVRYFDGMIYFQGWAKILIGGMFIWSKEY